MSMMRLLILAGICAKVGFVAFGGGYGMIPLLHDELVVQRGWLTEREFLDGVALSQITPGPILVVATFAGWKVAGALGAAVATIAITAPSAILTILLAWQLRRMRDNPWVRGFLAGVRPAIVGLIAGVGVRLALALAQPGPHQGAELFAAGAIALGSLLAVAWAGIDPALAIIASAAAGVAIYG